MKRMKLFSPGSPLFVWQLLFCVTLICVSILTNLDPSIVRNRRIDLTLKKKLNKIHFNQNELNIIFLGNSLLRRALPASVEEIEDAFRQELRKRQLPNHVRAYDLTFEWVSGWNLPALESKLFELHPSVVVFQIELLIGRDRKETRWGRLWTWGKEVEGLFMEYLPESLQSNGRERNGPVTTMTEIDIPVLRKNKRSEEVGKSNQQKIWKNQEVSFNDPRYLRGIDFIRKASKKNIKIIIVEMPIDESAARFASSNYFEERSAAARAAISSSEIHQHVQYPSYLPHKYFADYHHLNPDGRTYFFPWLAEALVEAIAKSGI